MHQGVELEKLIKSALMRNDFDVKTECKIDDMLEADIIAMRGGRIFIFECVTANTVGKDSISRLNNIGNYMLEHYKPMALKKLLVTTTKTKMQRYLEDLTYDLEIHILKIDLKLTLDQVERYLEQELALKPVQKYSLDALELVKAELKEEGEERCLKLFLRIYGWYHKGGRELVTKKLKESIEKIGKK